MLKPIFNHEIVNTMNQKGFSALIFLLTTLIASAGIVGGSLIVKKSFDSGNKTITPIANFSIPPSKEVSEKSTSEPTQSNIQTNDWNNLHLSSCGISLKYPKDMEPDVYNEMNYCSINILSRDTGRLFYLINLPNSNFETSNVDSLNKEANQNIIVDNVKAVIVPSTLVNNFKGEVFTINKGEMIFTGSIKYKSNDMDASKIMYSILTSIKFTKDDSSYKGDPNVDFRKHITENATYKNNANSLKTIIEIYKLEKGQLPDNISQLSDGNYLNTWGKDETSQLSNYLYQKKGATFTVTVKLHDGSDYIVEGAD